MSQYLIIQQHHIDSGCECCPPANLGMAGNLQTKLYCWLISRFHLWCLLVGSEIVSRVLLVCSYFKYCHYVFMVNYWTFIFLLTNTYVLMWFQFLPNLIYVYDPFDLLPFLVPCVEEIGKNYDSTPPPLVRSSKHYLFIPATQNTGMELLLALRM